MEQWVMLLLGLVVGAAIVGLMICKGNSSKKFKQVKNKARHMNANAAYWHICSEDVDMLFTDSQLKRAADRAIRNPEDLV